MLAPTLAALDATLDIGLSPRQLIGIPIAVLGAVLMSVSAMLQHRGVSKVDADSGAQGAEGLGMKQFLALLRRPSWLFGTVLIGVAILLQFGALLFAPLVVVQPIGVISLIVTTIISARQARARLRRSKVTAVITSVVGVGGFVTVAAMAATDTPIGPRETVTVLIIAGAVVLLTAVAFLVFRRTSHRGMFYILAGGVLYGFVATFAKLILTGLREGRFDGLSLVCLAALLVTVAVGGYFVQTAYASGSTDMVIAGLTVVDPIVAVTIGIVVLHETAAATPVTLVLFVVFGAIAIAGVFLLNSSQTAAEIAAARRHALGVKTGGIAAPVSDPADPPTPGYPDPGRRETDT